MILETVINKITELNDIQNTHILHKELKKWKQKLIQEQNAKMLKKGNNVMVSISYTNSDGDYTKEFVGEKLGSLAIVKLPKEYTHKYLHQLIHIPSGLKICDIRTKRDGRLLADKLNKMNIDWESPKSIFASPDSEDFRSTISQYHFRKTIE